MLLENIKSVKESIRRAAFKVNRDPESIKLIAVTKNVALSAIKEAAALGTGDLGESKVQEAREKFGFLTDLDLTWHMVGHLQTNKVKYAVDIFEYIHSLDSIKLAEAIENCCQSGQRQQKVFIEVNISEEESKFGVKKESLESLVSKVVELKQLDLIGFMTIAPFGAAEERVRAVFKRLRVIRDNMSQKLHKKLYLSMGMSDDFEIAIEEGADFIRIGRAIFNI
jgi:PLP dependent protein